MIVLNRKSFFLLVSIGLFFSHLFGQTTIKPSDQKLIYEGRVAVSADTANIYWPGTSVYLKFKGASVGAKLKSIKEDAYFYAVIDDSVYQKVEVLQSSPAQIYALAQNLNPRNKHRLQLFKLSNSTSANQFYGFELDEKAKVLQADALPKRKIEFYGNSITVGHGVDRPDSLRDDGRAKYFNNYYSYAAITARHFKAHYVNTSRSGIGVMVSWFPEIMPETFDRLDPLDSLSKWDFKNYQPDIIVVNLFQNDSWLVNLPNDPQFKRRFGTQKPTDEFIVNAYKALIGKIREKNKVAKIICALGNMDAVKVGSKWPGYVKTAVQQLNDPQMYTCIFKYKDTDGHPRLSEQRDMADQLIQFIEQNIKW